MKKKSVWKRYAMAALLLINILRVDAVFAIDNRAEDIQAYTAIFTDPNADVRTVIQACERLGWAGLDDPQLFDIIEKKLLATYKAGTDRDITNTAAWLSHALAYSGQEKYRATLQDVAKHSRASNVTRHAEEALEELSLYTKWNPIISDHTLDMQGKSGDINRFANMLRSNEKALQEIAARRIINDSIRDADLLAVVQQAVTPDIRKSWSENDAKSVAYMLKALAVSGQAQFISTVEDAAQNATTPKVRKYAEGYLKKR
ncbi:MAG: hypothetical protein QM709_04440 [Spongiibacteraceae bacterium]